MRRIKILVILVILMMAAMFGVIGDRNQTQAAEYSCKLTSTCPGSAKCEGDRWTRTGDCSISCYKESGAPGEIVFSGSANCGASSGSSGTGGTGGSGGGAGTGREFGGGYCYDNWLWDSNCESNPWNPYEPPLIN